MAHTQATWKALSIIFSRMARVFMQFQYRMNPTLKSTTNQWTGHLNNCSHLFGTTAQMWEQNWWPLNRFTSIIHTPIQFWWAISAINSNALQAENFDYNCFWEWPNGLTKIVHCIWPHLWRRINRLSTCTFKRETSVDDRWRASSFIFLPSCSHSTNIDWRTNNLKCVIELTRSKIGIW